MRKAKHLFAILIAAAPFVSHAASFDCSKARSDAEKLVCSSPDLSKLDDELARLFIDARDRTGNSKAFREEASTEWQWREANCHDRTCVKAWYAMRRDQLMDEKASGTTEPLAPSTPAPQSPPKSDAHQDASEIPARVLFAAYHDNEVAADQKYKGKSIRVRGIVHDISKDVFGDPYITMLAGSEFQTITLRFSKPELDQLATLHAGNEISVTCIGSGMFIGAPVLDCTH